MVFVLPLAGMVYFSAPDISTLNDAPFSDRSKEAIVTVPSARIDNLRSNAQDPDRRGRWRRGCVFLSIWRVMHHLGNTRSALHPNHLLQTPDTFVRASLPGMRKATAIVHVSPEAGAKFVQYTAELEADGSMAPVSVQRFVYVLEGELNVGGSILAANDYAYCPPDSAIAISSKQATRAAVIEKSYEVLGAHPAPSFFTGSEAAIAGQPLMGDEAVEVRPLIPAGASFDFAVNTMTYQPGAALSTVEMHIMEHGLLMLAGGGIYRLSDHWYPVTEGDFIWMGPYCPQWFGALGKVPAKYLIYKDWNR
jgi:(S)-ureidoglycine aminohydrolase